MVGMTRRGRSERDEELESVREELREVRRELRETTQLMRGQGSRNQEVPIAKMIQITLIGKAALRGQ